jgi:hypothetical protein
MSRKFIFADESGNFDFTRNPGASKYFILTTLTATDCIVGQALLDLRRTLAWEGVGLNSEFHATEDLQAIRDRVYQAISPIEFRLDATILEKCKAQPSIRNTPERFYKIAWYLHTKYVVPQIVQSGDELLVVGASLGTKKRRALFHAAVDDVILQVTPTTQFRVASWACSSDPCLQAADYCAWAIQRKWESGDSRSYDLIKSKLASEFEVFRVGGSIYY